MGDNIGLARMGGNLRNFNTDTNAVVHVRSQDAACFREHAGDSSVGGQSCFSSLAQEQPVKLRRQRA